MSYCRICVREMPWHVLDEHGRSLCGDLRLIAKNQQELEFTEEEPLTGRLCLTCSTERANGTLLSVIRSFGRLEKKGAKWHGLDENHRTICEVSVEADASFIKAESLSEGARVCLACCQATAHKQRAALAIHRRARRS